MKYLSEIFKISDKTVWAFKRIVLHNAEKLLQIRGPSRSKCYVGWGGCSKNGESMPPSKFTMCYLQFSMYLTYRRYNALHSNSCFPTAKAVLNDKSLI